MNQERMIVSFDDTKLFSRKDIPENSKAVVVIAHGLAEHLNRYDALTKRLFDDNFAVYRYDQRGHARSEGKRTFFNSYEELAKDCKTMVDLAKSENPDLPVYLIGHSMGGYTVTLFVTMYPNDVAGVVTSGALTRYSKPIFGELPIDAPADSYIKNALGDGVCSDPKVVEEYVNDPLVEKEISIGLINSLADGLGYLKENSEEFVVPALILHGADDGLVSEQDSRELYGEIGSTDKTLKIYGKLYHEIFNEIPKQEIYTEVIDWLNDQLKNN